MMVVVTTPNERLFQVRSVLCRRMASSVPPVNPRNPLFQEVHAE